MSSFPCPQCRHEIHWQSDSNGTTTCPNCESRLVVAESKVKAKTKLARFVASPLGLAVGWPMTIAGQPVDVLGRIQYRYESGYWDEFHLQLADRSHAWISVDEGRYIFQKEWSVDVDLRGLRKLDAGESFMLGDTKFQVREIGFATMVGMQGALPFVVEPNEIMHFVELTSGDREVTVEIFRDESYHVFEGELLDPTSLQQDTNPRRTQSPFQKIYGPPVFEELEQASPPKEAAPKSFMCPKCGKNIMPTSQETALVVCPACRHGLDITDVSKPQDLFSNPKNAQPVPFKMGQECSFEGIRFRASGSVRYRQKTSEGTYHWTAFQLVPLEAGTTEPYFLENEDGHWTLFRPIKPPTQGDPNHITRGQSVTYNSQTFEFAERGYCQIVSVDGELTWVPKVGDQLQFVDLVKVPEVVSCEWTREEMEWSHGTYLDRGEVALAFGMQAADFEDPRHYLAHQPFPVTTNHQLRFWASVLCGCFLWFMGFDATRYTGERIFSDTVLSSAYLSGEGYVSPPIEIPEGVHVCKLSASSRLTNRWVEFSFLFTDDLENIMLDEDAIVERYEGPGWTEGSGATYQLVKLTGPRTYRLNLFGESGTWSQAGGDQPSTTGPSLDIALDRGVKPASGWFWAGLVAFVYPVIRLIKYFSFHSGKSDWLSED